MKTIFKLLFLFIALTLLFTQCELFCDDCVDIPDKNFRKQLIEEGVDTNGDRSISFSEAKEVISLTIWMAPVQDLTGIEAFINLDTFLIYETNIASLDLSNNTALTYLVCSWNQLLTSLDVSKNTALTYLECSHNQLSTLDVSNCTALECLNCSNNQLNSLDVRNCTALSCLDCSVNLLTALNISHNTSIGTSISCPCCGGIFPTFLGINNMPSLYAVCVWTMPFPIGDIYINSWESPNVYFTTACIK